MAVFTIQTPSGKTLKIEAADQAAAIKGAREWDASQGRNGAGGAKPKGYEQARAREASLQQSKGLLGGLTDQVFANLGVQDEMQGTAAFLGQGAENIARRVVGAPVQVPASTAYRAASDVAREKAETFRKEHPVQNAVATGAGFASGGAVANGVPLTTSALRVGATTAGVNAPFALARQEGSLGERLPGAATETALAFSLGSGGQLAGNALGRVAQKVRGAPVSPARKLAQEGVQLTPGQMMGGAGQRVEDALTSVPLTGDAIRSAQRAGVESFDRVAINRVLEPIGETLPANVNVGRDAVRLAQSKVSDAYNKALDGVVVPPDAQLTKDLAAIAARPLRGSALDDVQTAVSQVQEAISSGPISARALKEMDEELGIAIRGLGGGPTNRAARRALMEIQDALDDALGRASPEALAGKAAADEAFANLVRIETAAGSVGARGGVFSAPQLQSAVKAAEGGGRRSSKFARGDALMQDLTDDAVAVLPATVPDSGTAFRSLMQSPVQGVLAAAPTLPVAALYSKIGMSALNAVYRAKTPGAGRAALAALSKLAARDPALAAEMRKAEEHVLGIGGAN